jgi:hypothetical protein
MAVQYLHSDVILSQRIYCFASDLVLARLKAADNPAALVAKMGASDAWHALIEHFDFGRQCPLMKKKTREHSFFLGNSIEFLAAIADLPNHDQTSIILRYFLFLERW